MTKAKQQWEAEMERLNSKYNLDCFWHLLGTSLPLGMDRIELYQ